MRVLIVTDAFPPRCGGSGWSTFHLARALAARGHAVRVVKPEANLAGVGRRELEGIPVADFGYALHDVPYVRSFERDLWLGRRLERFLAAELEAWPADVVHGQHALSTPPAIAAAAAPGAAVDRHRARPLDGLLLHHRATSRARSAPTAASPRCSPA